MLDIKDVLVCAAPADDSAPAADIGRRSNRRGHFRGRRQRQWQWCHVSPSQPITC